MRAAALHARLPTNRVPSPNLTFHAQHVRIALRCSGGLTGHLSQRVAIRPLTVNALESPFARTAASAFARGHYQNPYQLSPNALPHGAGAAWPHHASPSLQQPTSGVPAQAIHSSSGGFRSSRDRAGIYFFATCHPGLEEVVARELLELGYGGVECSKAGVGFRGRRVSDGYTANLWLRSAIRVLVLLAEGRLGTDLQAGVRGGQALYDMVYDAVPWHDVILPDQTFSVEPRLYSCTDISSTSLVWSRVKDAVCDSIRDPRSGSRRGKPLPPEKGQMADVPLYVSCYQDHVKIFRDMSGQSLHRRGYRDVMHRAALNESAAAGVLTLSGWREALEEAGDGEGLVFADPMCGSGTLLIEAALMARDIAPGFMRSLLLDASASGSRSSGGRRNAALAPAAWPFQRWGDYDPRAWSQAVEEARDRVRPPWKGRFLGVDVHEGALSLAERQAKKAGIYNMLELTLGDCGSVVPAAVPNMVVCNPPWGGRLHGDEDPYDSTAVDGDVSRGDAGGGGGEVATLIDEMLYGGLPGSTGGRGGRAEAAGGRSGGGSETLTPEQEAFLAAAWRSLDGFLYRQCPGASATVVSGSSAPFRYLKLKPQSKHRLVLSGVQVQVASYKIRDAASRSNNSPPATPPLETREEEFPSSSSRHGGPHMMDMDVDDSSTHIAGVEPKAVHVAAPDKIIVTSGHAAIMSAMTQTTERTADAHAAASGTGAGDAAPRRKASSYSQAAAAAAAAPSIRNLDADEGYWLSD